MKKGQKKRIWTKEDKLKIIQRYTEEHISARELGKLYNADHSMICRWIREYPAKGNTALKRVRNGEISIQHYIRAKGCLKRNV